MFINVNVFSDRGSDALAIQAAVDRARQTGQTVVIPRHNARTGEELWQIDSTVLLYSGSTLLLQGCHLRMADGAICNMFSNSNARSPAALTEAGLQRDITIRGIGGAILDGGIHNGLYEVNGIARTVSKFPDREATENCTLFFQNVEGLCIEGLHIKDPRYWAIALCAVSYSRVAQIRFSSCSNVPNQDGVDLLKGCHDVIIENITGCVGDNLVALLATDDAIYPKTDADPRHSDIRNITVRNVMAYGVGGCALIRLLNHDGYRIYNVRIDNVMETSPWSRKDAPVAPNPDLNIRSDEEGNIYPLRQLTPGEEGYRCEAAILIGESYWYNLSKAQPGDTFGITVSNVMTHARYGICINNTLQDASFENIRMFGNGFAAVYFGEGSAENLRFSGITYDKDCRPLPADAHIFIPWNNTRSDGFSCVYCNGTHMEQVFFRDILCGVPMDSVFGGWGSGRILHDGVKCKNIPVLSGMQGIELEART